MTGSQWILWGSALSPFFLKTRSMLDYYGWTYRVLPDEGGLLENLSYALRWWSIRSGSSAVTHPRLTELDELPLVPYLLGPDSINLYDSSAIGEWLDHNQHRKPTAGPIPGNIQVIAGESPEIAPLLPDEDPAIRFVIRLIDEYFDEFGLYMAHHNRWKVSAGDNRAGERLAHEMRNVVFFLRPIIARRFSARQVRRMPYLFSIAPPGFQLPDLPPELQPPAHYDFPPTHALLENCFEQLLKALEPIFQKQRFLLGDRFTLADAALYGQLGMNLSDPEAASWIQQWAPRLYSWLLRIERADFSEHNNTGRLQLHKGLVPLLKEICRIYPPLMVANEKAYMRYRLEGVIVFNEPAYRKNQALFDTQLGGQYIRSVVKTFQVKTWRSLQTEWVRMQSASKKKLLRILPRRHGLDPD
ncbi:MAG: glutathione S-transferase C-terminal domain-containing protein [Leptospiraceae bacterium]|nr:glutathione S-transferase C-terminal domain-containing protein [Leptospiraceae bacterium]